MSPLIKCDVVRGRLAQWLERCVDIAEVTSSSLVLPTTSNECYILLEIFQVVPEKIPAEWQESVGRAFGLNS